MVVVWNFINADILSHMSSTFQEQMDWSHGCVFLCIYSVLF